MPDILDKIQSLSETGKSHIDKQRLINVNEVFYIWDIMVAKFDILETIGISESFIEDRDLKAISGQLAKGLQAGIDSMEKLMFDYSITFPVRPPADCNPTADIEYITDRYIYKSIFEGIQSFFPILSNGFMNSTSPKVRKAFKKHLLLSIELMELIVEYGKLKGYIDEPPFYRA